MNHVKFFTGKLLEQMHRKTGIMHILRMSLNFARLGVLDTVRIEACSNCQLRCPACPTGTGKNRDSAIGSGYLKFSDFKMIVDENRWIKNVELSNYGEIFLNPELEEIIRYAHKRGINITAGNGVNLNNVSNHMLECLVKYEVRFISVSIDGASDETYRIYRRGGDFDMVIRNIEKINEFKKKYNSEFPRLGWQFVVFGHNEHEISAARKMAEKMNMDFSCKLNFSELYPVRDKESVRRKIHMGVASEDEFRQKYKRNPITPCHDLWFSPQINWDGKLLGCCINTHSDFGNVFVSGLLNCLRSEKYVAAKDLFLGKPSSKNIACSHCACKDMADLEPLWFMTILRLQSAMQKLLRWP